MALYEMMAFKATQGELPYKYLGVVDEGGLMFNTDEVLNQNAKFAVEYAHSSNIFHIRSCFTNKYWVRNPSDFRIVAIADEPVEDETAAGCTLFKLEIDDDKKAKFYHVQSGAVVRVGSNTTIGKRFLTLNVVFLVHANPFVVDYNALVVFPRFLAFKGSNNLYYKNFSSGTGEDSYAHFSVREISDPNIVCECFNSSDGHIRIRAANMSDQNMFWSCDGNASGEENLITWNVDNPTDPRQMFDAISVGDNVFALRSRFNNKFCMRSDYEQSISKRNRLVAKGNGPLTDARLQLDEPVFNRTVNVYEFNLDRARIYGISLLYSHEHIWDNYSDEIQSGAANGTIITTNSNTLTNTATVSLTVTTTIETGIPFLAKGHISVSTTGSYARQWGEIKTETQQVGHTFTVTVLPRKSTIARGVALKGRCDVPFSYVQRDYPADGGPPRVTTLHDGWFKGGNAYNFRTEVRYDELPQYTGPPEHAPTQCIERVVESIAD